MPQHRLAALLAGLFLLAGTGSAQTPPGDAPAMHPWQVPPPRLTAEAYFTNLKDGDRIETPYLVKFGLSGGWGLAPIAQPGQRRSGHHHLLINRDLPLDFKKALPFNDQYIHFGKGQMETVLTLPPGDYTLRMLLADQQHLPHFVYSKPTRITVTRKTDANPASLQKKALEIGLDAPSARPPLRVRFHASGLNVAQQAQKIADTGHFRLTMTRDGGGGGGAGGSAGAAQAPMHFVDGQTEVWLAPPAGNYTLRLDLVDNLDGTKTLAEPVTARLEVR